MGSASQDLLAMPIATLPSFPLNFTSPTYFGSIPENSVGKVLVSPSYVFGKDSARLLWGIPLGGEGKRPFHNWHITYHIVTAAGEAGEAAEFFKAESALIGDFLFLNIVALVKDEKNRSLTPDPNLRTTMFIQVSDTNDLDPIFPSSNYTFRIDKDMPLHRTIGTIYAEDADEGINGEIYYSFHPSTSSKIKGIILFTSYEWFYFTSQKNIGNEKKSVYSMAVVAVDRAEKLDSEVRSSYTLAVTALYSPITGKRKQTSVKIRIFVIDVNDNDPAFDMNVKEVFFHENQPPGSTVIKIKAKDKDSGENGYISFTFANLNAIPFEIDHFTGVIRSTKLIDYESDKRIYKLRIRASDWGYPFSRQEEMELLVRIQDVNDNRPQFDKTKCIGKISRNLPIGSEIFNMTAIDLDEGNIVSYRIESGNEDSCFGLDKMHGTLSTLSLEDVNNMEASKVDGNPIVTDFRIDSIKMEVNIHPPVIINNYPSNITVKEATPIGTKLFQVQANDRDLGFNGLLLYVISSGDYGSNFRIDTYCGDLYVDGKLDRESISLYELTITVFDQGLPQKSSLITLYINVEDNNDNPPIFFKSSYSYLIPENVKVGSIIASVNAKDIDEGLNGRVQYSIKSKTNDFLINSDTAKDSNPINPLISFTIVRIKILDINDEQPIFTTANYFAKVPEDIPIGTVIGTVNAYDPDLYDGGKVMYRFEEATSKFYALIEVQDINENYNSPFFDSFFVSATIKENETPGTFVFQVQAKDADFPHTINSQITYSIRNGSGLGIFSIDSKTGSILPVPLWIEKQKKDYWITIYAQDQGLVPLYTSLDIYILILNVNDNVPYSNNFSTVVNIQENSRPYTKLLTIEAFDDDAEDDYSKFQIISFYIIGEDPYSLFQINSTSGVITTTRRILDREAQKEHILQIMISDSGSPPLNSTFGLKIKDGKYGLAWASLQIFDTNLNKNEPIFIEPISPVQVLESDSIGRLLTVILVQGNNLNFFYITSGDDKKYFYVTVDKGSVILAKQLNYSKQKSFNLTITVWNGYDVLDTYLSIEVLENNENGIQFEKDEYNVSVSENADIGSTVLTALDINIVSSSRRPIFSLYYTKDPSSRNKFIVNPVNGAVILKNTLNREVIEYHYLVVSVKDQINPSKMDFTKIRIFVMDHNDNSPKFMVASLTTKLLENIEIGGFVAQVIAVDNDVGLNGQVLYTIESGNVGNSFIIDSNIGIIRVSKKNRFNCTGRIYVKYNYISPIRKMSGYSVELNENEPIGTYVLQIKAESSYPLKYDILPGYENHHLKFSVQPSTGILITSSALDYEDQTFYHIVIRAQDHDSGINSFIKFDIMEDIYKDVFSVESNTGVVRSLINFDHEFIADYTFNVILSDCGNPSLSSEVYASIKIHIIDENDTPPIFLQSTYISQLSLPLYSGVKVIQIQALDRDGDSELEYKISENNSNFIIDSKSGNIFVRSTMGLDNLASKYDFKATVSDGKYNNSCSIIVHFKKSVSSGLAFGKTSYNGTVIENTTRPDVVLILTVLGTIKTTGAPFDREVKDKYEFIVEASSGEKRKNPRITHVDVTIYVLDLNDNVPFFVNKPYYTAIPRNAAQGLTVLKVSAVDNDSGSNGVVYYQLTKGNGDMFQVNRSNGNIFLRKYVEMQDDEYFLTVAAYDGGNPPLSSDVLVVIKVLNEVMPLFEEQLYRKTIPENLRAFTPILSVNAITNSLYNESRIAYIIESGNEDELFEIDFDTGAVMIEKDYLDYETKAHYQIIVRAIDTYHGHFANAIILLDIENINDCIPMFDNSSYFIEVEESISVGTSLITVSAFDADNYELSYYIHDNVTYEYLFINASSGEVTLKKLLDYELQTEHKFILSVRDKDDLITLTSDVEFFVKIININDNAPFFEEEEYFMTYCGSRAHRGQFIGMVRAVDIDGDVPLKYSIAGDTTHQIVSIDNVSDGVYSNYAIIWILQYWSNYETLSFLRITYNLEVDEDIPEGTLITTITASEKNRVVNLRYSILSDIHKKIFRIDSQTGELYTLKKFDRELVALYEVSIMCSDTSGRNGFTTLKLALRDINDNPPKFELSEYKFNIHLNASVGYVIWFIQITVSDGKFISKCNVSIEILDENDNPPICPIRLYQEIISEDSEPGTYLLTIESSDMDEDSFYGQNVYSLSGKHQNLFNIDAVSGSLFTSSTLDREFSDSYDINVVVFDKSNPQWRCSSQVNIKLRDVNDNIPIWSSLSYRIALKENIPVGFIICKIKARDKDIGFNRKINYKFLNTNIPFRIHPESGIITLSKPLDRETIKYYNLTLAAVDEGYPKQLSSSIKFLVTIIDFNDNPPVFTSKNYVVTLNESVPLGYEILNVLASSKDEGDNAKTLGSFFTNKVLDYENVKHYYLTVEARDQGNPPLSNWATVNLTVLDVNDNAPIFKGHLYFSDVNENIHLGSHVLQVSAKDLDSGNNNADGEANTSPFTFDCRSGNEDGFFRITQEGTLEISKLLNFELKKKIMLQIRVFDNGYPPLFSDSFVTINVVEASKFRPTIAPLEITINSYDDDFKGANIGKVIAIDQDPYDNLTYELVTDSFSSLFRINKKENIDYGCLLKSESVVKLCGSNLCINERTCFKEYTEEKYCNCNLPENYRNVKAPCDSSPCLNGGICTNLHNDFHCECPDRLSSKRCTYGKLCNPNPCLNSGVCEEGAPSDFVRESMGSNLDVTAINPIQNCIKDIETDHDNCTESSVIRDINMESISLVKKNDSVLKVVSPTLNVESRMCYTDTIRSYKQISEQLGAILFAQPTLSHIKPICSVAPSVCVTSSLEKLHFDEHYHSDFETNTPDLNKDTTPTGHLEKEIETLIEDDESILRENLKKSKYSKLPIRRLF
ncbi:FAT1_2_3 [Lepeophtheirus salmonis]|uniref:FAT1_2_3 n=1 Tax=Lepeophtheirus salmonis TaxID=72036 RepID=A0A7R8CGM9_LEPSM|nr:FAT1_2_3 [Lepeophtheirus salmonis]CAF2817586.1 FAT1_2_3 [Lepeophtheirus salmonis]